MSATSNPYGYIPYCQHMIEEEEIDEVVDTLRSSWLTTGPKAIRFEKEFAAYVGAKYAVAVNSCTAGLHIALAAHGITAGDEVITTPLTFCATAEVVEYLHAKPVFADIDPDTYNIDPQKIEAAITPKTRAIIPVHYSGIPCNLEQIYEIADRHKLIVIEDAAHASGSTYRGKMIGGTGRTTAFSFYPTKNMTTSEGGIVTTDDEELATKLKMLSLHGISKDAWKRYSGEGSWYYEIHYLGYKYNFTDLQAAIGLQQLRKLDRFNAARAQYARRYFDELSDIDGLTLPAWYGRSFSGEIEEMTSCWHLFVIHLDGEKLPVDRNRFIEAMTARGIGTSVHFIPLHLQPFYANKYGYQRGDFPVTEGVFDGMVSLPLYPGLSPEKLDFIISTVKELLQS